jgi:hypothetical protein
MRSRRGIMIWWSRSREVRGGSLMLELGGGGEGGVGRLER